MTEYLSAAFPDLTVAERARVVSDTVTGFMAGLIARPRRRDPEELVRAAEDAALDRRQGRLVRAADQARDEELAMLAFQATPDAVRAVLKVLSSRRRVREFLIITLYLDLGDEDRSAPPPSSRIAALLDRADINAAEVREVLIEFRELVGQVHAYDASAP